MNLDINTIRQLIYNEFSEFPKNLIRISMGVMNFNFEFEVNTSKYIIRISPFGKDAKTEFEYSIMSKLYESGCMVPEPICFSNNSSSPFMIYKRLEGNPLSSILNLSEKVAASLSKEIVGNLNCLTEQIGHRYGANSINDLPFQNWNDFLGHSIDEGKYYLSKDRFFNDQTLDSFVGFMKEYSRHIVISEPRLVWSDLSRDNIIERKKQLVGFVDFEGCFFGDPMLSLGYFFALEGKSTLFNSISTEFSKYYTFTDKTITFYAILRLFRLAQYLNSPLPIGIKRDSPLEYFKGLRIAISQI